MRIVFIYISVFVLKLSLVSVVFAQQDSTIVGDTLLPDTTLLEEYFDDIASITDTMPADSTPIEEELTVEEDEYLVDTSAVSVDEKQEALAPKEVNSDEVQVPDSLATDEIVEVERDDKVADKKLDASMVPDTVVTDTLKVEAPPTPKKDTVILEPIQLTPKFASDYLQKLLRKEDLWRAKDDTMKLAILRLVNHFNEPFDSVRIRLGKFPYQEIEFAQKYLAQRDTLPVRWLTPKSFIIDTTALDRDPVVKQQVIFMRVLDPSHLATIDTIPALKERIDELIQQRDTITEVTVDTEYLKSKRVQIYQIEDDVVTPSLVPARSYKKASFIADSSKILIQSSRRVLMASDDSPFYIVPNERMPDSLNVAVEKLLEYTLHRDSTLLQINDILGRRTPMWLTTGRDELNRFWVLNSKNDSITVWIGNPSRGNLSLFLEEDVNVERMEKKMVDDVPFITLMPQRKLAKVKPLQEIPVYWDKGFNSSYSLNQNHLSNWARGGESSITSMLDINGKAEYHNREAQTKWTNTGRIRYATTWTDEHGFRTNTDIIEFNSQINKNIRDKIDFSSGLYMRTQAAKGYNYPNDSVVISKFLNPGTFTLSTGFEYKPNGNTTINFSPLSYRNTFVLDTANIRQTGHGIESGKRARHEMGGQLVARNTLTIWEDMKISNAVRLFSSYLDKPQNVDIDWEMSIEKQISWYFKIRLNLHLIYDDDIRFPVLDANDKPILLPDGSEKRVPRTQINQLLGLTLSFKL